MDEEVFGFKKLIAVHAGLEKSKPVESQMNILCERDVKLPRVEPLSGRTNVWNTPPVSMTCSLELSCINVLCMLST